MRIVAIGLGGAGCRIVDSLYSTDRRSSKVACIQALAVDVDEATLKQLTALPENSRLGFPAMDPEVSDRERGTEPTSTIDIAEIVSRIHNFESGETDAVLICVGLGGSMADIAPHVITSLRSSIVEPVFGLVTLPCLAEGEKRSAKAADDIDILSPLLDGMILFDNETWYKKTKALKATLKKKERSFAHRLGLAKDEPELSPELATYQLLNEGIVRRISLILRAGEFKADGGIDLAEVVLDSGEVLNTMKGMGFITIGYAVERLTSNPLAFLSQFRPQGGFDEENKKKASRIVDLAKQAIYHEISTPCDMTSAHKALVLIAGPSHELSMKGFMTVRKWIDRSIAGLETRSGDYPVVNTANVAIIIMLSGLENIPRVSELREIRSQYLAWSQKRAGGAAGITAEFGTDASPSPGGRSVKDEMIILPVKMRKGVETASSPDIMRTPRGESSSEKPLPVQPKIEPLGSDSLKEEVPARTKSHGKDEHSPESSPHETAPHVEQLSQKSTRHRIVVTRDDGSHPHAPTHASNTDVRTPSDVKRIISTPQVREIGTHQRAGVPPAGSSPTIPKDAARQRIELELQKQRLKAMSGRGRPESVELPQFPPVREDTARKKTEIRTKPVVHEGTNPPIETVTFQGPEKKTVLVSKRKLVSHPKEPMAQEPIREDPGAGDVATPLPQTGEHVPDESSDDMTVAVKDIPFRAKDRVFQGSEVQKPRTATVKDTSLIQTRLKPKKASDHGKVDLPAPEETNTSPEPDTLKDKTDKKEKKQNDISWI